jgi:hypothetical protein
LTPTQKAGTIVITNARQYNLGRFIKLQNEKRKCNKLLLLLSFQLEHGTVQVRKMKDIPTILVKVTTMDQIVIVLVMVLLEDLQEPVLRQELEHPGELVDLQDLGDPQSEKTSQKLGYGMIF